MPRKRMTKKELIKVLKKHPTRAHAARALGVPESTFRDRLKRMGITLQDLQSEAGQEEGVKKTIDDFKTTHDRTYLIPTAIKNALSDLGPEHWLTEAEFMKSRHFRAHKITKLEIQEYSPPFEGYIVELPRGKSAWAGSTELATQLQTMVPKEVQW